MNEQRKCLVGNDNDYGWLFVIIIGIMVVAAVCAIVFYGGAFIGGFHSIKNYVIAFKHNVFDSNRKPATVA